MQREKLFLSKLEQCIFNVEFIFYSNNNFIFFNKLYRATHTCFLVLHFHFPPLTYLCRIIFNPFLLLSVFLVSWAISAQIQGFHRRAVNYWNQTIVLDCVSCPYFLSGNFLVNKTLSPSEQVSDDVPSSAVCIISAWLPSLYYIFICLVESSRLAIQYLPSNWNHSRLLWCLLNWFIVCWFWDHLLFILGRTSLTSSRGNPQLSSWTVSLASCGHHGWLSWVQDSSSVPCCFSRATLFWAGKSEGPG